MFEHDFCLVGKCVLGLHFSWDKKYVIIIKIRFIFTLFLILPYCRNCVYVHILPQDINTISTMCEFILLCIRFDSFEHIQPVSRIKTYWTTKEKEILDHDELVLRVLWGNDFKSSLSYCLFNVLHVCTSTTMMQVGLNIHWNLPIPLFMLWFICRIALKI